MRIFLSHSGRDKALIREIKDHFPPWLKTWIDEEQLLFGEELAPALKDAINLEVDYVVLLFGREAADSVWVKREIAWALEKEDELARTFLLPVLLGDSREHLAPFGLDGRLTLELHDFTTNSTRSLAERLINHLGGWMSGQLAAAPPPRRSHRAADSLTVLSEGALSAIDAIPAAWRADVESLLVRPFVHDLAASRIGAIPLTPAQYYNRILAEIGRADETCRVTAVSTLSSDLWDRDANQTRYAARNLEAVQRGATIQRLFILPEQDAESFSDAIDRQEDAGIIVRVAPTRLLAHSPNLEDFVLFETPTGSRAYVSLASIDGSRRIRSGTLHLSDLWIARMRDTFADAWELATTPSQFLVSRPPELRETGWVAPGLRLHAKRDGSPVVTCTEAAAARGIPLSQELKTLLLQTHDGLVAAHLPGDGVLDLRKVKVRLETAEAYLADPEDLLALGLSAGTVCAVLEPVWSMPHLITRRVLTLATVMTNNGTKTGYFEFDPAVLTEAADVIVDDFEK